MHQQAKLRPGGQVAKHLNSVLIAVVTSGLLVFTVACGSQSSRLGAAPTHIPPVAPGSISGINASAPAVTGLDGNGEVFKINLEDPDGSGAHRFDPGDLTFDVGDTINFQLSAESELHTFTVAELEINQLVLGATTAGFSFTFEQPGTFALVCIPHESLGMTGTITVQ